MWGILLVFVSVSLCLSVCVCVCVQTYVSVHACMCVCLCVCTTTTFTLLLQWQSIFIILYTSHLFAYLSGYNRQWDNILFTGDVQFLVCFCLSAIIIMCFCDN